MTDYEREMDVGKQGNLVDMLAAIDIRRSRRSYKPTALNSADVEAFQSLISDINEHEDLNIQLVVDDGKAFEGFKASYGMFSGVRNYIALVGKIGDFINQEKLGYFGEKLVLEATLRGLGTCWVAGTFDRGATPIEWALDETIVAVITVGEIDTELTRKEKILKRLFNRGSKSIEQMTVSDEPLPEWFLSGMQAVQRAPSAVNKQPVKFRYSNDVVTAFVEKDDVGRPPLDLGIAKLHFEIGAGGGSWVFGNYESFAPRKLIKHG
jgi:nitroreductase